MSLRNWRQELGGSALFYSILTLTPNSGNWHPLITAIVRGGICDELSQEKVQRELWSTSCSLFTYLTSVCSVLSPAKVPMLAQVAAKWYPEKRPFFSLFGLFQIMFFLCKFSCGVGLLLYVIYMFRLQIVWKMSLIQLDIFSSIHECTCRPYRTSARHIGAQNIS